MFVMRRATRCLFLLSFSAVLSNSSPCQDTVRGHLITFNDNGAWSWFEDERAIVDVRTGKILVGSSADGAGVGGSSRSGDCDVATLDLEAGRVGLFELRDRFEDDDHDTPALIVRPDGRYLAVYAKHNTDRVTRWRVSVRPGDATAWSPERSLTQRAGVTYSNVYRLRSERSFAGRMYNFCRSINYDPNVLYSDDDGSTWSYGGKLLTEGSGRDRPYLRYASDDERRVHLIATERHPRDFNNSIYHGYVENGQLRDSSGAVVDANILDASGRRPSALTRVFAADRVVDGVRMTRAWTVDVAVAPDGSPRVLFQTRANDRSSDHRLFFGVFDGRAWNIHQVCRLGAGLYGAEADYTGLAALHPEREGTIYVSTPIDPRTNTQLQHHEIFEGVTADGGQSWRWTPITENSSVDNLRPIVPKWQADRTALLWFRGQYFTYRSFRTAVVGVVDAPELEIGKIRYIDATRLNTTLASGASFRPTGPSSTQGATDNRWHQRTGWGNGGDVLTSDERGTEDAPMLRTRVQFLTPGRYDVFAFLWSNPADSWRIRAGFTPSGMKAYGKHGSEGTVPADFTTSNVVRTGRTVVLYKAWLGRVDVDTSGRLDVYVDDLVFDGNRSWYDGIGYAPVTCSASITESGYACGGAARLISSGLPSIGGRLGLTLSGGIPQAFGVAMLGFDDLVELEVPQLGLGCVAHTLPLVFLPMGSLSGSGLSSRIDVALPNDTKLLCARANFQGLVLGSNRYQLTPALVARIGR